ncbi:MAG: Crp/Fnr family transcriptional regulator [Actinomycetota bacterium]|nr:Crp/Fnr family transcriptional regulator [Actinomycetota bacterium]
MESLAFPLLDALDPGVRARALDRAVARDLQAGSYLHFAGEPADFAHFVVRGAIMLGARDSAGNETSFGLVLPGEVVDEAGLLGARRHEVDAAACVAARVLAVDAVQLRAAIAASPRAAIALARHMESRLSWTRRAAQERATGTVAGRLAGQLLDLATALGRPRAGAIELTLPVDQARLAALAGSSREMTCRTLRRFKSGGVVDYNGRELRILRPDMLHRLRCGAVRNAGRAVSRADSIRPAAPAAEPSPSIDAAVRRRSLSTSGI